MAQSSGRGPQGKALSVGLVNIRHLNPIGLNHVIFSRYQMA